MKKQISFNQYFFITRKKLSLSISYFFTFLTVVCSCNNEVQPVYMNQGNNLEPAQVQHQVLPQSTKKIDFDLLHKPQTKSFTIAGEKKLREAFQYGERLIVNMHNDQAYSIKCIACNSQIYSSIFYYLENDKNFCLCPSCIILGYKFEYAGIIYVVDKGELRTKNDAPHDLYKSKTEEDLVIKEVKTDSFEITGRPARVFLINKTSLTKVPEYMFSAMEYICNFPRRNINERKPPFTFGEGIESMLAPELLPPYIFLLAHVASLYESNNFSVSLPSKKQDSKEEKFDIVKLFLLESENLPLSLCMEAIHATNAVCLSRKTNPGVAFNNAELMSNITRYLTAEVRNAVFYQIQKIRAVEICNAAKENIGHILMHFLIYPSINHVINSVKNLSRETYQIEKDTHHPAKENTTNPILEETSKINFDDVYDTENDSLTETGKKCFQDTVKLAESIIAPIYKSAGELHCSVCEKKISNLMLLTPRDNGEMYICINCLHENQEFKYNGKDYYTIKNKVIYYGKEPIEGGSYKTYNINNILKLVPLEVTSNVTYVLESMYSILKELSKEKRRPLDERSDPLCPSEFIEKILQAPLLPYYLLYLANASCLYYEFRVKEDSKMLSSCVPSKLFISILGADSLYIPTLLITHINNYLCNFKIDQDSIIKNKKSLLTMISRYLAQLAILKERQINEGNSSIKNFGSFIIAEKLQKDTNLICDKVFGKPTLSKMLEETDIDIFKNFEDKSLFIRENLDLSLPDYKKVIEAKNDQYISNLLDHLSARERETKGEWMPNLSSRSLGVTAIYVFPLAIFFYYLYTNAY